MSELMPNRDLRQCARQSIALRLQSPAQAWPRFGRDLSLLDEDGPDGSLLFACRTDPSMSNPLGIVHGGITAALLDTCMGVTCSAQCGRAATPTVTLTVNYVRPVPLDAQLRVRTRTVRIGRSTGQLSAEVPPADHPEEILATATGVFSIRR